MKPKDWALPWNPARYAICVALTVLLCLCLETPVQAQVPVDLFQAFAGNVSYQATGGSLRTQSNPVNACTVGNSGSAPITGIPAGSTIRAAYLYWAGSGATPDYNVTFNGTNITASRTFTEVFTLGNTYNFFSGFADVTSLVTGNGTYTFSNLTVNNGAPFCAVQAVLSGWSLVVIYANPVTEPVRVLNVFDGFQFFRGSSLTLTLANFRASPSPDGKLTAITWEGDSENSGANNGFTESLTFNGTVISDGLNPPANQFNSTVNTIPSATTYGVDVDTYIVDSLINPGDLSATGSYSSGADLVLLSAQVAAFASDPIVDLSITKTHTGDFIAGNNHDYAIQVSNGGLVEDPGPITVTDTLPTGLTYVSGSGTGWTCGAVGQDVTCTNNAILPVGNTLPDLTLTVAADENGIPSVTNTATVSTPSFDTDLTNNTASDATNIIGPDLSTSTKTVVDLDGGDVEPGDTLRYTITINETAGLPATIVAVTDDMPALVENFNVVSIPTGATDNSTGAGTGANGAGFLDVANFNVPANGSVSIVFDVDVIGTAVAGDVISNTANVNNPTGPDGMPAAPDLTVQASSVPTGGTKTLYLYDLATPDPNGFNQGPQPYLSRTPPPAPQGNVTVDKPNPPRVWTMTPALQAPLTVQAGTLPVTLWLSKGGGGGGPVQRVLTVTLNSVGATAGPIGAPVTLTLAAPPSGTPAPFVFPVPVAADVPLLAGSQVTLTVTNVTPGGGNRRVRVFPIGSASNSRIDFDVTPVIRVDSLQNYDAAYAGGVLTTTFNPTETVYVRAVVSDPFGSFDITSASIDIVDALGAPQVTAQSMTLVADSGADTRTYEFAYTVPANGVAGTWTTTVTAVEGTEGTVTHARNGSFVVGRPDLVILKTSQTISDPVNGTINPKAIPGAVVRYSITVTNQGEGDVDASTLVLTDLLPAGTSLFVDDTAGDPIQFANGSPVSGLGWSYAANVSYSSQAGGGPPYTHPPAPDGDGFDAAITEVRIAPTGVMNGASGGTPSFTIRMLIRID